MLVLFEFAAALNFVLVEEEIVVSFYFGNTGLYRRRLKVSFFFFFFFFFLFSIYIFLEY
jgi:hypothetical protein